MKSLKDWNIQKTAVISIASIFSIIVLLALIFGVFDELKAWEQMIAAMLSVAATIAITGILLAYQSKQQEELNVQQREFDSKHEKKTKIFEEKLKIYQDFLDTLYSVLEDGVVTPEDALKMKFKISSIALHTNSQGVIEISTKIEEMFQRISKHKDRKLRSEEIILEELLVIVNQFKKELYDGDSFNINEDFKEAIENFKQIDYAISEATKPFEISQDTQPNTQPISLEEYFEDWRSYINSYGWRMWSDATHPLILSKLNFEMKIEKDDNGWYFMVYSPFSSREIYLHLRRLCGGAFISNQCWYLYFDDEYRYLSSNKLKDEVSNNVSFKSYLMNYYLRIVPILECVVFLKEKIMSHLNTKSNKWNSWLYLDEGFCLANDYGDEYKHPFIDVILLDDMILLDDDNRIQIDLSLRNEAEGELHDYLISIGIEDDRQNTSSQSTERWSKICRTSDEAVNLLNMLIRKIENDRDLAKNNSSFFSSSLMHSQI